MLRKLMLRLAANNFLVGRMAWLGRRSGLAGRFIAGENLEAMLGVVAELRAAGLLTTLDLLGEGVTREAASVRATEAYIRLLREIGGRDIDSNISIKPTQLGLAIDRELCRVNLAKILNEAVRVDGFVRIDMESSRHTQDTLDLFREARDIHGTRHVGIVIQSYLRRSEGDARDLCARECNIRLCKGAYMEPPEVAFPRKRDVDLNFLRLVDLVVGSRAYCAVATHDDRMIRHARETIRREGTPDSRFEFQMLYGVRRERQLELKNQGHKVRVYVPFGTEWAPYFMRRLAERPANLLFVARNLLRA